MTAIWIITALALLASLAVNLESDYCWPWRE